MTRPQVAPPHTFQRGETPGKESSARARFRAQEKPPDLLLTIHPLRPMGPSVSDTLFPSGPWTGFYNYRPGDRHRMDLHLTFENGRIDGFGVDDIGRFLIRGRYDPDALECWWTKSYVGGHDVFYRGFREGRGIWGTWEITAFDHGGFHIWPRTDEETARAEERAAAGPQEFTGPHRAALPSGQPGRFSSWPGQGCATTGRAVPAPAMPRFPARPAPPARRLPPCPTASPECPATAPVRSSSLRPWVNT